MATEDQDSKREDVLHTTTRGSDYYPSLNEVCPRCHCAEYDAVYDDSGGDMRQCTRCDLRYTDAGGGNGVRLAGVNLYVLFVPPGASIIVKAQAQVSHLASDLSHDRFWYHTRTIEGWELHQVTLRSKKEVGKQLVEPEVLLNNLPTLLDQMLSFAYSCGGRAKENGWSYLIIHIKDIKDPRQSGSASPHRKGVADNWNTITNDLRLDFRAILDKFDPLKPGEPRGYFNHYDADKKRYGYLAVGRRVALLANLSDQSYVVLASLLQSGTLMPMNGFTTEGLSAMLTRVTQWNTSLDVRESVDHITQLKQSSDASTHGQIWLSYALAVIGVTLSLITSIPQPIWLTPGLILIGLSCVAHARYAQEGGHKWHRMGKIAFWVGIAAILIGTIVSSLLFLLHPR